MKVIKSFTCVALVILPPGAHAEPVAAVATPVVIPTGAPHDFDFEFGAWRVHIRRLLHPLTGSTEWVDLDGTSVVRKVWDGRADLGELEVTGGSGSRIEGLSLRLYDPASHQWRIHWANAGDGLIGEAMRGGFSGGRGLFYNKEMISGRPTTVRFVFTDVTASTFRLEQSFSPDDGATWEVNWIATFQREAM